MSRLDMLDRVSRAIWFAEWEEPYPAPGTIHRALAEQMGRAAIQAMADELLQPDAPSAPAVSAAGATPHGSTRGQQ